MVLRATIGKRTYVLDGAPVFQPITEFITAVRQGNASNDDRNLANFASFEDSRGGIGVQRGNIREDFDKLADNEGLVALHFNELIKPPKMFTQTMASAGKTPARGVMRELAVDATTRLYVGYGAKLYYSNGTTAALTACSTNPLTAQNVSEVIEYTDPVTGTKRGYIASEEAGEIVYFTDPTAGSPFTAVAGISAEMLFQYDGKLWAGGAGVLRWAINPTVAADWTLAAPSGAWPNTWKFIGVYQFGQSYFPVVLANHTNPSRARLAVLDLDNYQMLPLTIGATGIVDAFTHEGAICVITNDGRDAILLSFNGGGVQKHDLDWLAQQRGGFSTARRGLAVTGFSNPHGPCLVSNITSTYAQLFFFKGTGWHPYGKAMPGAGIRGAQYVPHLNMMCFLLEPSGSNCEMENILWQPEAFTPGVAQSYAFEPDDMEMVTPRFSLGFDNLSGPLLSVECGGWQSATEQILVEYQLDNDSASWVTLGTLPNTTLPEYPEVTGRAEAVEQSHVLLFDDLVGVPFTSLRLRLTLSNDTGSPNLSPNAYPFIIRFFKRPKHRFQIKFNIDAVATIGERAGPDIDGIDAIWLELAELYDEDTIPHLVVGPYETWAALTGMPFVLDHDDESPGDMIEVNRSKNVTIQVAFAELL